MSEFTGKNGKEVQNFIPENETAIERYLSWVQNFIPEWDLMKSFVNLLQPGLVQDFILGEQ